MTDKIDGAITLLQDELHDTQSTDIIEALEISIEAADNAKHLIELENDTEGDTEYEKQHKLTGAQLGIVK